MTFKVSSTTFYNRLSVVAKVISNKSTMPILECVLIEVKDGELTLTASDSQKHLIAKMPVIESTENARFCVQAQTIIDSIRDMAEQPITLDFNPDTFEINGHHSCGYFSITALEATAYPAISTHIEDCVQFNIPAEYMLNGITHCEIATSDDNDQRLVMKGVYTNVEQDRIVFVGTDGRMLVRDIVNDVHNEMQGDIIIPNKVIAILKNLLNKDMGDLVLNYNKNSAYIEVDDIVFAFSLIDGKYPSYEKVIPTNNPYVAVVDRPALLNALKRILVFCNKTNHLARMEFSANHIKITGQDFEYATSAEEYINHDYNGIPIHIGFDCKILIGMLAVLSCEQITLSLADPSRPGIITPITDEKKEETLMLLMPLRVE